MAWVYLLASGAAEIVCMVFFRYTEGLTRPVPTAACLAAGILSFYLMYRSLDAIPLGTAYAVWSGISVAGTVLIGILFYAEPVTAARMALLTVLLASIVGLNLVSDH